MGSSGSKSVKKAGHWSQFQGCEHYEDSTKVQKIQWKEVETKDPYDYRTNSMTVIGPSMAYSCKNFNSSYAKDNCHE